MDRGPMLAHARVCSSQTRHRSIDVSSESRDTAAFRVLTACQRESINVLPEPLRHSLHLLVSQESRALSGYVPIDVSVTARSNTAAEAVSAASLNPGENVITSENQIQKAVNWFNIIRWWTTHGCLKRACGKRQR